MHLAGYRVRAATLSLAGAMETAVLEGAATGLVFPLFMAGGWFARVHLPARLKAAGAPGWSVLEPFGRRTIAHFTAVRIVGVMRGVCQDQGKAFFSSSFTFVPSAQIVTR